MRRYAIVVLSLVFGLTLSNACHATFLTFTYEGTVNFTLSHEAPEAFDAFVGDTMRVQFTFDSTTQGDDGYYLGALTYLSLTIGENEYTAHDGDIIIINTFGYPFAPDQYLVMASNNIEGPSVGGLNPARFTLGFTDITRLAFGGEMLPLTQPDPADFTGTGVDLTFACRDPETYEETIGIIAANDTVRSVIIPEPCSASLVLLGLIVLARQKRQH